MTNHHRLALIRAAHTAIYVVMATACFALLFAALTGLHGEWLWWAIALVSVETAVFASFGMKCPLTALAVSSGSAREAVADTYLPERITRYTFRFFAPLILVATAVLVGRAAWWGWD